MVGPRPGELSRIVRGLLGTGQSDPALESASPSPSWGSIWHRIGSGSNQEIDVESMPNRCWIDAKSTPEEGKARRIRGWGPGGLCLINPSQLQNIKQDRFFFKDPFFQFSIGERRHDPKRKQNHWESIGRGGSSFLDPASSGCYRASRHYKPFCPAICTPVEYYRESNSENILLCNCNETFQENNFQTFFTCNSLNQRRIHVM